MIKLVNFPKERSNGVENIKIREFYCCYGDIALFWEQSDSLLSIAMLDGNMILDGKCGDITELKEFIKMINPKSIFAKSELLENLGLNKNITNAFVMKIFSLERENLTSDELSSKDVFSILNGGGLSMPPYEYFAVDFCRRLNLGRLKYFGLKDKACAVSIGEKEILINGILSKEKGFGSYCLKGILSKNKNKTVYAVCKEDVKPFYLKNGFIQEYKVGYWINVIF